MIEVIKHSDVDPPGCKGCKANRKADTWWCSHLLAPRYRCSTLPDSGNGCNFRIPIRHWDELNDYEQEFGTFIILEDYL